MKRVTANRRRPRKVLLFSGHMIDAYDRAAPRFPPSAEKAAAAAIDAVIEGWAVGAEDLGITEGACGGDLLFAEALLTRGASLELRLPFREPQFIEKSVGYRKKTPPPDRWVERFHAVAGHERATVHPMPDARGPLPRSEDPFKRCNLWMLRDAIAFGAKRVRFLCLWNGARGDGPGGTAHMRQSVRRSGGKTVWLDTRKLWET